MNTEFRGHHSPSQTLEALRLRFGAFEAIARAVLGASSFDEDMCPPMDTNTAWAVYQFADDLKAASEAAEDWMAQHLKKMDALEAAARRPHPRERAEAPGAAAERPEYPRPGSPMQRPERPGPEDLGPAGEPSRAAESHDSSSGLTAFPPVQWDVRSFEAEGSEHRTRGSIAITGEVQWSATLAVPVSAEDGTVFLQLERQDAGSDEYHGDDEVGFFLAERELVPVVNLIQGVVSQAHQDGVLRRSGGDTARGEATPSPEARRAPERAAEAPE
jgi:hypothetical protein